ncbi:DsbA family protein [Actinorhabdospora filicis]|uniref:DsbA family protein n=1 Tax=Actinorhabdospora filicis TaxID=1785913 RepID=A0A9W6W8E6_9ACTN|nr:DsbA family protein [Actinorhabdospora filicis]GLZ76401.1 DsbA family protein [Actinorhabdospora filicis]
MAGLIYVFDAYCGWCWGFSATMTSLADRHPELPIDVISGGLMTGPRRRPLRDFGYIADANERVTRLTGARFGKGFRKLFHQGDFVMDSEAAARAVAALRAGAEGGRMVAITGAYQRHYFTHGNDLGAPETVRAVADEFGLDAEAVLRDYASPGSLQAAEADFHRAQVLGAEGFPTLLATLDGRYGVIARGAATLEQVEGTLRQNGIAA